MRYQTILLIMMFCWLTPAHAIITVTEYLTSSDVTITNLNDNQNTMVDEINSLPGGNIQGNTVSEDQLTDSVNPVTRWDEVFNDFVVSGLLPPTSASLSATTTAGTAYIQGVRVAKDATAKTYTANRDTYVDLSSSGVYTYSAVANGAAEPSTATNSLRLAKVVTDGTTVSSVTDLRVLSASVSTYEDFILKGMECSPDTSTILVKPGVCYVGSSRVSKIANTTLTFATGSDWWDGAVDTYAATNFCYIGVSSDSTVKLLGNNPPDYHDTNGNQVGNLYYWNDGGGYWRVIGRTLLNTSEENVITYVQEGDTIWFDTPRLIGYPFGSTTWKEISLDGIIASCDVEAFISVSGDTNTQMGIRNARNNGDSGGWLIKAEAATNRYPLGWIRINEGQTYYRAIDYKQGSGNMAIYIDGVRMKLRN